MIHKFNEQFTMDKNRIKLELEEIKSQQDVLKISYTINEKQLLEKIQSMIYTEIRMVCQDKEKEILMNIWIDKLNEIVTDFEKLKKVNPKEFNLQINEISKTIELFKLKLQK